MLSVWIRPNIATNTKNPGFSRNHEKLFYRIYCRVFIITVLRNDAFVLARGSKGNGNYLPECLGILFPTTRIETSNSQLSVHPSAPVPAINVISHDFQDPFSLNILNSRTKLAGLDFYLVAPAVSNS